MPLPPVAYFSIQEIALRWGCTPADVAGWAVAGHLHVVAGIPPVVCAEAPVAGMVEVPMAELMAMFPRVGPGEDQARLRRVMPPGSKVWFMITDPAEGVLVRSSALLVEAGMLRAFEEEHDLMRRPVSTIGASPRYDWDAMYAWLTVLLYERGIPDTQTALVGQVQDWFIANSKSGEVPDESTIRKRLTSLWRKLKREEPA